MGTPGDQDLPGTRRTGLGNGNFQIASNSPRRRIPGDPSGVHREVSFNDRVQLPPGGSANDRMHRPRTPKRHNLPGGQLQRYC
jgi:hypothetical protein